MEKADLSPDHPSPALLKQLLERASRILSQDPEKAAETYSRALETARGLRLQEGEGRALYGLGECARTQERYDAALKSYSAAASAFSASGNMIERGRCYRRLGDIHYFVSNCGGSMECYLEALRVFERDTASASSRLQTGHLMATIGNVLRASGDLDSALDYYRRCRGIYEREGFSGGIPGILYNEGNILCERGEPERAKKCYERALSASVREGDGYLGSLAHNSMGSILLEEGDLETAREHFEMAYGLSEKAGREKGMLSAAVKMAELERRCGDLHSALRHTLQAGIAATRLNDRSAFLDVLTERTRILCELKEFERALRTSIASRELADDLHSEKRMRELDELRLRFEAEERERRIAGLREEKEAQRRITLFALAGLAAAGVSLVSLYRTFRFRVRTGRELENKNRQLEGAFARVEKLSRTDDLTGLANRRAMMEALEKESSRSKRSGKTWALIMADIDGFKQVNDRFGHGCGDRALVHLAGLFRKVLRKQDTASRWGGEEFLILLPETSEKGALQVAEKLRRTVCSTPLSWKGRRVRLTLTLGVSAGCGKTPDKLIRASDQALYRGKKDGRNRVSL